MHGLFSHIQRDERKKFNLSGCSTPGFFHLYIKRIVFCLEISTVKYPRCFSFFIVIPGRVLRKLGFSHSYFRDFCGCFLRIGNIFPATWMISIASSSGVSHLQKFTSHIHTYKVFLLFVHEKKFQNFGSRNASNCFRFKSPIRKYFRFIRLNQKHPLFSSAYFVKFRMPAKIYLFEISGIGKSFTYMLAHDVTRLKPSIPPKW